MPSCLFYADESDFNTILSKLNNDPEIAIIVSDGKRKWIAKNQVSHLDDGRYFLWHIASGKLPLFKEGKIDILGKRLRKRMHIPGRALVEAGWIEDPFGGWKELCPCADSTMPFFGGTPKVVEIKIQTRGIKSPESIGLSAFGWLGNRHSVIGYPAKKEMVNWWRRINRWVSKTAIEKIPRWGPIDGPNPDAWAFPSAYSRITDGKARDTN